MSPQTWYLLGGLGYAVGAAFALAGLRREAPRRDHGQLAAVGLGVLAQSIGIGIYCAHSETHFFSSVSESLILASWALGVAYLAVLAGWSMRSLGSLILPLNVTLLLLARWITQPGAEPIAGSAAHPLFAVHVMSAFLGYGLFLTACAASLLYLREQRLLKRKIFNVLFRNLPSLEKLERASSLCAWSGLFLFSVAVGTGDVMALQSGLSAWYFEPKILATWATWLVFLVLALGRLSGRLAGRAMAKVVLTGALLVCLTFLLGHPFREPSPARTPPPQAGQGQVPEGRARP